jgi:putative addiction module CopG family antidote
VRWTAEDPAIADQRAFEHHRQLATIGFGGRASMSIQLPPQAEAIIRQKVDDGLYPNPDAALDAAVRLLDEYDRHLQRLREAIAEGEEGEAEPWTPELMDRLTGEAEAMQFRGERPDPDVCP